MGWDPFRKTLPALFEKSDKVYSFCKKGSTALIAWFKAELALQDEDTQKRLGGHSDEYLAENQNSIDYLVKLWRDKRLPVADAVAVA